MLLKGEGDGSSETPQAIERGLPMVGMMASPMASICRARASLKRHTGVSYHSDFISVDHLFLTSARTTTCLDYEALPGSGMLHGIRLTIEAFSLC